MSLSLEYDLLLSLESDLLDLSLDLLPGLTLLEEELYLASYFSLGSVLSQCWPMGHPPADWRAGPEASSAPPLVVTLFGCNTLFHTVFLGRGAGLNELGGEMGRLNPLAVL